MKETGEQELAGKDISSHVFGNSPTLLALCITVIGLIKIYASLQRITTVADNLLLGSVVAFLLATIFSYFSLRSRARRKQLILEKVADGAFLFGLCLATLVALLITFTLAG
jgi:hypothetical protein